MNNGLNSLFFSKDHEYTKKINNKEVPESNNENFDVMKGSCEKSLFFYNPAL